MVTNLVAVHGWDMNRSRRLYINRPLIVSILKCFSFDSSIESLRREIMPDTQTHELQFHFGLVDFVVRDTLTQFGSENGVQRASVLGSYELLNCFVTVRPFSSSRWFVLVILAVSAAIITSTVVPFVVLPGISRNRFHNSARFMPWRVILRILKPHKIDTYPPIVCSKKARS